jgi:hypothetical protein
MVRSLLLIVVLLVFAVPSYSESFHVTATTCHSCWTPPGVPSNIPNHTIDAILSVIPGTGTFWDPFFQTTIPAAGLWEVVQINGLIDGIHPMTLMVGNQGDGRSWLTAGGGPGLLWFNIAGFDMRVFNDHAFDLLQDRESPGYMGTTPQIPLQWAATVSTVAEPSSFVSLVTGVVAAIAFARRLRWKGGSGEVQLLADNS